MANSITGWNTFAPGTLIESAKVNADLGYLKDQAPLLQKFTVAYATFSAMGATAVGTQTVFSLAADDILSGLVVKHSASFSGGGISAAKLKVGIPGNEDKYLAEFDVLQSTGAGVCSLSQLLECEFSATSLIIVLSLTGGNLNALTRGSVDIYVKKSQLPS